MRAAAAAKFGWHYKSRSQWSEAQWVSMANAVEGGCWLAGAGGEWTAVGRAAEKVA